MTKTVKEQQQVSLGSARTHLVRPPAPRTAPVRPPAPRTRRDRPPTGRTKRDPPLLCTFRVGPAHTDLISTYPGSDPSKTKQFPGRPSSHLPPEVGPDQTHLARIAPDSLQKSRNSSETLRFAHKLYFWISKLQNNPEIYWEDQKG
jgi:hypothetical protein